MTALNLPEYPLKSRINAIGKIEIYDPIRRKYVILSPEEEVRQRFIQYLILQKGFPKNLMSVEKGLKINNLSKRTDIVQYNKQGKPIVIVECKAPHIQIDENTFAQAAMYNMKMQVDYLIITNGITHFCCKVNYHQERLDYLPSVPHYNEIDSNSIV
jgi:hypothetical protein